MPEVSVRTWTTGRILIEDPAVDPPAGLIVGCHGYGQDADAMLDEMRRIPGHERWRLASVQALHRFYTRNNERVVASWMTRQDRENAITDNIEYLRRAVEAVAAGARAIVYLGFSQGASMAARAAARADRPAAGLIMLGGDIPPDVREDATVTLPPTLIGVGSRDTWYNERLGADVAYLTSRNIPHELVRFDGGHEFTDAFRRAAGAFLERIAQSNQRQI